MSDIPQEERATDAINQLTSKVSNTLLEEFKQLPEDMQLNVVLIKTVQLLLANVLCHVAVNRQEFDNILEAQGDEIKELTYTCASTAFADKFEMNKH